MEPTPEPVSRTYRFVMAACAPVIRWWGRLEVKGLENLPRSGPTLVIGNHDSYWDPIAIGTAGRKRRQIRALAKSTLWKVPGLGPILNGMGQVPIERDKGDANAMARAVEVLAEGGCIGVFPEGTTSRGRTLRARSGAGRLALDVPGAVIVPCTVTGTVDIVRFPKRPRIRVEFLPPAERIDAEDAAALAARITAGVRELAPIAVSGRKRKAAANAARAAAQRESAA